MRSGPTFAIVGLALTTACLNFDPFLCNENAQCDRGGEAGVCQMTGYCAYPDEECLESGLRYEPHAGDGLAGQCVDPTMGTEGPSTSFTGPSTSESESTETNPSSTDPATSEPTSETSVETGDNCGAAGQACCAGSCDGGLECFADECSCVVAIDAGDRHTCAVLTDGSIYCWGANDVGQLGEFVGANAVSPEPASALFGAGMRAIEVSATRQTCAVRDDGSAVCWGDNAVGQVAPGDATLVVAPFVTSIASAILPATGGTHSCIAREDGNLMTCFGDNDSGQLTTGTEPGPIDVPALFMFAEIELGSAFGCGRQATGEVYCWGSNGSGQLAAPAATTMSDTLLMVTLAGPASDIAVGRNHACASVDDVVYCWGANNVGQLGDGSLAQQNAPVTATLGAGVVMKLEAGPDHTCVVQGGGSLHCWGSNQGDQLLIDEGPDDFSSTPVLVPVGDLVVEDVTGGVEHACVLTDTHQVHCWGPNAQGEAGVGMAGYVFAPQPIDLECP